MESKVFCMQNIYLVSPFFSPRWSIDEKLVCKLRKGLQINFNVNKKKFLKFVPVLRSSNATAHLSNELLKRLVNITIPFDYSMKSPPSLIIVAHKRIHPICQISTYMPCVRIVQECKCATRGGCINELLFGQGKFAVKRVMDSGTVLSRRRGGRVR